MALANSILLFLNQSGTLSYGQVLGRFSANYSTINSARAALSRAMRNLVAKGLLIKHGDTFEITPKGRNIACKDMETQLILKINEAVQEKESLKGLPSIVKQFSVLIEWGKLDAGLVKITKDSSKFDLARLRRLDKYYQKRIRQSMYLEKIFSTQIEQLKEWNFHDSSALYNDRNSRTIVDEFVHTMGAKEVFLQFKGDEVPAILNGLNAEKHKEYYILNPSNAGKAVENTGSSLKPVKIKLFFPGIDIIVSKTEIRFSGQYGNIRLLRAIIRKHKTTGNEKTGKTNG